MTATHIETAPETLRPRMCGRKKKFGTPSAGTARIDRMVKFGQIASADLMNVYRCPFCTFYHIGHNKPGKHQ